MKISELLGAPVTDPAGRPIGVVRDLRVTPPPALAVAGVTVGQPGWRDAAAHAWGLADGRSQGPWPLGMLTRQAALRTRFVPAELVRSWGPERVIVGADAAQLEPLRSIGPS
jgi:hypothetical protein